MNIFYRVTWKAMWKNRTRTLVTVLGVLLAAAMFSAVATMAASTWDYLRRGNLAMRGDYYLYAGFLQEQDMAALRREPAVDRVAEVQVLGCAEVTKNLPTDTGEILATEIFYLGAGDETYFSMIPQHLTQGRLPENSGEILLPARYVYLLEQFGHRTLQVGDRLTLHLQTESPEELPWPVDSRTWEQEYTVVGFTQGSGSETDRFLITRSQPDQVPLWRNAYVRTQPPQAALDLMEKGYGLEQRLNRDLLQLYGVTGYNNVNLYMLVLCGILSAIIMAASVSLIYNAFSISVSERTKQFGLLASVGATRRQLRRSVQFEALAVSLMGIPLGLLAGYLGIAVVLHFLGHVLESMFAFQQVGVHVRVVALPLAFGLAAAVCLATVLLSAWLPARRAGRISPMEAVRGAREYRVPDRELRDRPLAWKLFGLPGILARKYYRISRKKYRATVLSLTVSILLFVSANAFCDSLAQAMEANLTTENYDFLYTGSHTQELRQAPGVTQAAQRRTEIRQALLPPEAFAQDYLAYAEKTTYLDYARDRYNLAEVRLFFLEDQVFRDYLTQQGLDPEPYFDPEDPAALLCVRTYSAYQPDGANQLTRYTYHTSPLAPETTVLPLLTPCDYYSQLESLIQETIGGEMYSMENPYGDREGRIILTFQGIPSIGEDTQEIPTLTVAVEAAGETDTTVLYNYYLYDPETGTREAEPVAQGEAEKPPITTLRIGAVVEKVPFGIPAGQESGSMDLILPLSLGAPAEDETPSLALKVSDYQGIRSRLEAYEQAGGDLGVESFQDYLATERNTRGYLLLIQVLSYGFLALITLIGIANVFNTISTNISLRRRDFGMLRSVGFRERELYRMLIFECLLYGSRALLYGLPLSLLAAYGIHRAAGLLYEQAFRIPWVPMAEASAGVFLVMLAAMTYTAAKLRETTPMEDIRTESI